MTALLSTRGLGVRFRTGGGLVQAVTDADLELRPGEVLALVGESGCGKSVLASTLLGLLPANAEVRGRATLSASARGPEVELLSADERRLAREVRGRRLALVPQSATSSLSPTWTARSQLEEVVRRLDATARGRTAVRARAAALAADAGLPEDGLDRFPHELSGGAAQRVVLAMARAGDPDVVLADEPTAGLDRPLVDAAADGLRALAEEGRAVLLITHDLRVVERVATRVAVMYASRLVEVGPAADVLDDPWHPYTRGLLDAQPHRAFRAVPGAPPSLGALPPGCGFAARCRREPRARSRTLVCSGDASPAQVADRALSCVRPC